MLEQSFILLRDIGVLSLGAEEEVRFSIDAYHGYRYVSIRRYLKQEDGFSGPTRDGVTLTPEIVRALVPLLRALPAQAQSIKQGPVGKFAKRPGICILVDMASFRGQTSLMLRQWSQEKGYNKNGICLPLTHWTDIRRLFEDTLAVLDEVPDIDF